jgi:hypothetical protein
MAKTFAKIGLCEYSNGFHIHLTKDLDADQPEVLRIVLVD